MKKSYEIEDVHEGEIVYSDDYLSGIAVGDCVKLNFITPGAPATDSMWVEIKHKKTSTHWQGKLISRPSFFTNIDRRRLVDYNPQFALMFESHDGQGHS